MHKRREYTGYEKQHTFSTVATPPANIILMSVMSLEYACGQLGVAPLVGGAGGGGRAFVSVMILCLIFPYLRGVLAQRPKTKVGACVS